jgi:hypothetical protein
MYNHISIMFTIARHSTNHATQWQLVFRSAYVPKLIMNNVVGSGRHRSTYYVRTYVLCATYCEWFRRVNTSALERSENILFVGSLLFICTYVCLAISWIDGLYSYSILRALSAMALWPMNFRIPSSKKRVPWNMRKRRMTIFSITV